jgi:hypothetical protein
MLNKITGFFPDSSSEQVLGQIIPRLVALGYRVEQTGNHLIFYRNTKRRFDRFLPFLMIGAGLREGKIEILPAQNGVLVVIQFTWLSPAFIVLVFFAALFLVFFVVSGQNHISGSLIFSALIIFPLFLRGFIRSGTEIKRMIADLNKPRKPPRTTRSNRGFPLRR